MTEPIWLDEEDVVALHRRMIALYGGADGIRDPGLLVSALSRPRQHFAYAAEPDIIVMAALTTAGIVRNHPFVDGNKRTGFVAGVLFLELNGYSFEAGEDAAAQAVIGLAAGTLDENGYVDFLAAKSRKRHIGGGGV